MLRNIFSKKKPIKKTKVKSNIRPIIKNQYTKLITKYGDPKQHRKKEYQQYLDKFSMFSSDLVYKPLIKPKLESVPRFMQKFDQRIPDGIITIFSKDLSRINNRNISINEKKILLQDLYNKIVVFEEKHHLTEMKILLQERINEIQQKIFGIVTEVSIFNGNKRHNKYERELFSAYENEWEVLKRNYSAILRNYEEKQKSLDTYKRYIKKQISLKK